MQQPNITVFVSNTGTEITILKVVCMSSSELYLYKLLDKCRTHAKTEREKGTYFENLAKAYFQHDDIQHQLYDQVWTYGDWAKEQDISQADMGIDLVAQRRDGEGYCAIQCKFYDSNYRLKKGDLDSFFTASGKKPFTRRVVIDTTAGALGKNAEAAFQNQTIESLRIGLHQMATSRIDWSVYDRKCEIVYHAKKVLRKHQQEALDAIRQGLEENDRGKLIMACGTGKTFTSLKIAEALANNGKRVLFLVPSLALMSQTVTEWTADTALTLRSFAVCSDAHVGKRKKSDDDIAELQVHDLAFPATTDPKKLVQQAGSEIPDAMTVIFSTYHSIQVISDAQKKHGLPAFDLIICDEAHRTTGAKLAGENESHFIKVHDPRFIEGKKRLYMTATPRIYGEAVKTKAKEVSAELCSMDDEALFGKNLFHRGFSWAVQEGLLTDYKVIVLAVDEGVISRGVQKLLSSEDNELQLDDATKIIGCYRALTKQDILKDVLKNAPMQRALAFCRDIQSSKLIESEFAPVVDEYIDTIEETNTQPVLHCEIKHVDGTFNAKTRTERLNWLKDSVADDECRILTNARCLSEGVDVPALDAIMFLHARKSMIDVVQSIGRVMRKAPDKKMGYVILPVGIPAGMKPEEALNDNEKYKVIWQILNAIRAHDDRFDATINKAGLGEDVSDSIQIIGVNSSQSELEAMTAVVEDLPQREKSGQTKPDLGGEDSGRYTDGEITDPKPTQSDLFIDEVSKAVLTRIVKKCGTRDYWEDWAADIANIAETHITRITGVVNVPRSKEKKAFAVFVTELRDDLNETVTEQEAVEMLAQHLITQPVFDALFDGSSFTKENPVSRAVEKVLGQLSEQNLEKENDSLHKFYESVKFRAQGIETAHGKQTLVLELYDKFFRKAFPRLTERLGIVYTPVAVVDFIIHSVNDVLKQEFNQSLADEGVHIIDPFTGTGTFITRLLQSGLIEPQAMAYKYKNEIHANEIVLLAYYIAAINIESVYHSQAGGDYVPFNGICLTDTFQLYEKDDLVSELLADNSSRRTRQKGLDVTVIIGNPPYSSGQKSANDNNANVAYKNLNQRIADTYAKNSNAALQRFLYDSYIRAIRWGSDRLRDSGIMAFVSGGAWIDRSFADGMRKCLAEEFSNLYILNLRGDIRKNMLSKGRAGEGGNVFGSGSMTGITITLFVKNPQAKTQGQISYYDIGNNVNREDKLQIIKNLGSVTTLSHKNLWQTITPDKHHDWINQRDDSFDQFIQIGNKKDKTAKTVFDNYSTGVVTSRDAWCYNAAKTEVAANMKQTIEFYNNEVDRYAVSNKPEINNFISNDTTKISWSSSLKPKVAKNIKGQFKSACISKSVYRPFEKKWLYFDKMFNERLGQIPAIFPTAKAKNRVIAVPGVGARSGFSALMVDKIPCLDMVEKGQCFPLKLYAPEQVAGKNGALALEDHTETTPSAIAGYTVKDGITDAALAHFKAAYPTDDKISKEDIFYYIYGLLHSEDYRNKYETTLSKQLPRIARVKQVVDFWRFVEAGRSLADLHINYEQVTPYPVAFTKRDEVHQATPEMLYRVEKWKFGGSGKNKDKTTVIYNPYFTMTNIPLEAYDYMVNGRSALEWVMERQVVKTDKASQIVNDANRYACETVKNPAYPLELFQRIITVSLETMKIVKALPKLVVADEG